MIPHPLALDTTLPALLAGERLADLEDALDDPAVDALERVVYRAELAARGRGPISDVILATRRLDDAGDPRANAMAAHAVRLLGRASATKVAATFVRSPLSAQQLEHGVLDGEDERGFAIAKLLAAGKLDEAQRLLEENTTPRDLRTLADVYRRTLEFDRAAAALERAATLVPDADDAPLVAVSAALARWAAGDVDALGRLRRARDGETRGAGSYAARIARDVLESVDRDPSPPAPKLVALPRPLAPMRTSTAPAAILDRVLAALGAKAAEPIDAPIRAGHLAHALRARGIDAVRATFSTERLAAALSIGALVVIDEERPAGVGFSIVLAVETRAELLLLQDPARIGPFLRHIRDQLSRSALYGCGALFIADKAKLAALGIEDDPRLFAIDRCDVDDEGRTPPRARIIALAEEAIAIAPDFALPYERLGEALLAEHESGTLGQGTAFERWLARTRPRFPEAEWPLALYARALEREDRVEEAGIAWSDAQMRDPFDERNWIGLGRTYLALGDLERAEDALRRALSIAPGDAAALALRGEISLERGDLEHAEIDAALACEIGGETTAALLTRTRVHEARGELDDATVLLERASRLGDAGEAAACSRLARRLLSSGRLEEAGEVASRTLTLAPSSALTWCEASLLALVRGDRDTAISRAYSGLERCGPDRDVLEAIARAVCLFTPDDALAEALAPAARLLEATPPSLLDLASSLAQHGALLPAIETSERASALMPSNPNGPWRTAQIWLAARVHDDRLEAALDRTIALAGAYPTPRVMRALLLVDRDPEAAVALLRDADAQLAPALVWLLAREGYARLGGTDRSTRARERLVELYPSGVIEPAAFLRSYGFPELAVDMLADAHAAYPADAALSVALAVALTAAHRPAESIALLEHVPSDAPLRASAMLLAARDAKRFELLAEAAARTAAEIARDSRVRLADPWPERAMEAGARLALGDETARRRLLDRVPRHPIALSALVRVERIAGHRFESDDCARLDAVAPGARRTLDSGAAY